MVKGVNLHHSSIFPGCVHFDSHISLKTSALTSHLQCPALSDTQSAESLSESNTLPLQKTQHTLYLLDLHLNIMMMEYCHVDGE